MMGEIIESRFLSSDTVKIKISMDKEEAFALKGHIDNINLIAEDSLLKSSRVIEKGKDGISKYFTVPVELLRDAGQPLKEFDCHRIETGKKSLFIYVHLKDEGGNSSLESGYRNSINIKKR